MPTPEFNSLLTLLLLLRPAFTQPSFLRFLPLFAGWGLSSGTHAVTESLVASGVSGRRHHAAFHRFFSRARWNVDELGRLLLVPLAAMAQGPLRLVLDDTLCHHKGPKVFGLGCHLDAVRSTRKRRHFTFGHVWVTLAVLVRVPFTSRDWALPILFRLYRTQAENLAHGEAHQAKTQLARQVLFRDLKQLLGFAASRARTQQSVLRTAPWVGICYCLLVLWYVQLDTALPHLGLPQRPWYRTKHTVSFADILRLAQLTLAPADWANPRALLAHLLPFAPAPPPAEPRAA